LSAAGHRLLALRANEAAARRLGDARDVLMTMAAPHADKRMELLEAAGIPLLALGAPKPVTKNRRAACP
jgi:hypothetical protein